MHKLVPSYYSEYGRNIDSYRAIPLNIDGLKLVERRVLWSLSKINKKTKSINAIGKAITIHPHGDMSIYSVMVNQVFQNRAIGGGNWGNLGKEGMTSPAAARYTEIRINNNVCKTSFDYIKDVPYENFDFTLEPLYLADVIPLGICGRDDITGVAFHATTIPRYKKEDLAKRLKWLLTDNNKDIKFDDNVEDTSIFGPLIKPQFNDCESREDSKYAYYELLMNGSGILKIIPRGGIDKYNVIHIQGKRSSSSFNPLLKYCAEHKINVIENNDENDPYFIDLELKVPKKSLINGTIQETFKFIWTKFLIKLTHYHCYFVDFESKAVDLFGIDKILLNNYNYYKKTVYNHYLKRFESLNDKYFENIIILKIKNIFNKHNIKTVNDVLKYYNFDASIVKLETFDIDQNKYISYNRQVTKEDIENIINSHSIKKLIEVNINLNNISSDINHCKSKINNLDDDCFKLIDSYL